MFLWYPKYSCNTHSKRKDVDPIIYLFMCLCVRSGSQALQQLPARWLSEVLKEVKSSDPSSKLCATRRSAGIPFYIQVCKHSSQAVRYWKGSCLFQSWCWTRTADPCGRKKLLFRYKTLKKAGDADLCCLKAHSFELVCSENTVEWWPQSNPVLTQSSFGATWVTACFYFSSLSFHSLVSLCWRRSYYYTWHAFGQKVFFCYDFLLLFENSALFLFEEGAKCKWQIWIRSVL